jgi:hypothetical protein
MALQHTRLDPGTTDFRQGLTGAHERRWSERHWRELGVRLHIAGQTPITGVTRDVSVGGLFVRIPVGSLALDSQVRVVFNGGGDGDEPLHPPLPARVIRLAHGGAGLMFSDFSASNIRIVLQMLYGMSL